MSEIAVPVETPVEIKPETPISDPYTEMLRSFNKPAEELPEVVEPKEPVVVDPILQVEPSFDAAKWLEEQSEGKLKSIDDFKGLLNREPEVAQPSFSNEQSKLIYEAIINGKEDEVYGYLAKKNMAATLSQKPTEEVVKAYIKEQYPTFNEVERDYFYNKEFGFNEEGFEDDEIGLSVEKKKSEAKLLRVKDEALAYFNKQVSEIQLPKFEPPQQPAPQGLDLNSEPAKEVAAFVDGLYKSGMLIEGNEIPFEYSNKENGASVKGKVTLDENAILQFEEKIGDKPDIYWAKKYIKNGEFDSKGFSRDQWVLSNLPKLFQVASGEGFNQGFLSKVMKDKNIAPTATVTGDAPTVTDAMQKAEWYKFNGFTNEAILKLTGIDLAQQKMAS